MVTVTVVVVERWERWPSCNGNRSSAGAVERS